MPRHHPTFETVDDGGRHGRRLERDQRARARRRTRRQQVTGPEDLRPPRTTVRTLRPEPDLDRQVADWRAELAQQG